MAIERERCIETLLSMFNHACTPMSIVDFCCICIFTRRVRVANFTVANQKEFEVY